MGTLYCTLENEADLYVNERQKIRNYRARSTEERRKIRRRRSRRMPNHYFLLRTLPIYVNLHYIAILYTHSIGNQQ